MLHYLLHLSILKSIDIHEHLIMDRSEVQLVESMHTTIFKTHMPPNPP